MLKLQKRVPVYLPDKTLIGSARIDVESGRVILSIKTDSALAEFFSEDLVGLQVLYLDRNRVEELSNHSQGEKTDAKQ